MDSKILIIGHGSSILSRERGEEIDSFPGAIVRLNRYIIEGFERHIGSRTDVYMAGGKFHEENASKQYIIVLVYMTGFCRDYFEKYENANKQNNVIAIPREEVYCLKEELKNKDIAFATTGLQAIYSFMIRGFDVYVHGFDFYRDGKLEYYDSENKQYSGACHEPVKERQYFNRLLEQNRVKRF